MTTTHAQQNENSFPEKLETLYLEVRRSVLQAAYRIIGIEQDAEDILHNVVVRLLERPELQPEFSKNPKGYLYQAVINEAINVYNAKKRQQLIEVDIDSVEVAMPAPDSDDANNVQRVRAAIATLNPDYIKVLGLFYYDGYTCFEISKLCHKPLGTVLTHLFRARAALKKALELQDKQSEAQAKKHQINRRPVIGPVS